MQGNVPLEEHSAIPDMTSGKETAMADLSLPPIRVVVFTLGGTISMTGGGDDGGVTPSLSGRQLLDSVPGLAAAPRATCCYQPCRGSLSQLG
jgi:L-asparaginase/Glu-tRNA(Gln) amidotransferase subunit D